MHHTDRDCFHLYNQHGCHVCSTCSYAMTHQEICRYSPDPFRTCACEAFCKNVARLETNVTPNCFSVYTVRLRISRKIQYVNSILIYNFTQNFLICKLFAKLKNRKLPYFVNNLPTWIATFSSLGQLTILLLPKMSIKMSFLIQTRTTNLGTCQEWNRESSCPQWNL